MKRRQFIKQTSLVTVGGMSLSLMNTSEIQTKIIPQSLKLGDTIALTAPAGAIFNKIYISKFETKLKSLGFKVIKGKSLFEQNGFLAGSDENRAKELNDFFKNKTVKAIFTMRGGWGCNRILDLLDYETIRNNPKIIMGYSDITSLIVGITDKTGLITYHGPMGYSSWKSFSTSQVYDTLIAGKRIVLQNPLAERHQLKTLSKGSANGGLIGGNLTVICSLIGTKHEPNWKNKILFLEETGEEPYRVDRMLWQLKQANVFSQINGVVLGSFRKCDPEDPERSFSLQEIINQHFKSINIPVFMGASFGHTVNKFNLPIGLNVKMNADNFTIELLENPSQFNG